MVVQKTKPFKWMINVQCLWKRIPKNDAEVINKNQWALSRDIKRKIHKLMTIFSMILYQTFTIIQFYYMLCMVSNIMSTTECVRYVLFPHNTLSSERQGQQEVIAFLCSSVSWPTQDLMVPRERFLKNQKKKILMRKITNPRTSSKEPQILCSACMPAGILSELTVHPISISPSNFQWQT
jgi:hypothetical protein